MRVAQNDALRANCIKAKIDDMQKNSKYRICRDRDEAVNYIISKCSKLAQKEYEMRYDWLGKVIHWELYKQLKFDPVNKWYMLGF